MRLWKRILGLMAGGIFIAASSLWANVNVDLVHIAMLSEDWEKASSLAEGFIAQELPVSVKQELQYWAGVAAIYQGHHAQAETIFQELVVSVGNSVLGEKAQLSLIDSMYFLGQYDRALTQAEDFIRRYPSSELLSMASFRKARILLKLGQWDAGREELQKITVGFPHSPDIYVAEELLENPSCFSIQVGSFQDQEKAQEMMSRLHQHGHEPYLITKKDRAGRIFYRVRLGKLPSLRDAQQLESQLAEQGYPTRIYP